MASEQSDAYNTSEREAGRLLFAGPCNFLKGVVSTAPLPVPLDAEVAFAGRSNVGKSSLLNALTGRKSLARTSNTPGRTREINYFALGDKLYLVDMPGYGYARVSKTQVKGWTDLIYDYMRGRAALTRVFLLVDARHGLKDSDRALMSMLDEAAVSYQGVLTKIDKLKKSNVEGVRSKLQDEMSKRPAAFPQIIATSARKGCGIADLRAAITMTISNQIDV